MIPPKYVHVPTTTRSPRPAPQEWLQTLTSAGIAARGKNGCVPTCGRRCERTDSSGRHNCEEQSRDQALIGNRTGAPATNACSRPPQPARIGGKLVRSAERGQQRLDVGSKTPCEVLDRFKGRDAAPQRAARTLELRRRTLPGCAAAARTPRRHHQAPASLFDTGEQVSSPVGRPRTPTQFPKGTGCRPA